MERVVLAYFWPGEEMTVSAVLERTRPAVSAGITLEELKRALVALEREGTFARRQFKNITLWRRVVA